MLVQKLKHILVFGAYIGVDIPGAGLFGQGADYIIGLEAADAKDWYVHRFKNLLNPVYLSGHIIRHWRAICFVFGVKVISESLAFCVEYAGDIIRRIENHRVVDYRAVRFADITGEEDTVFLAAIGYVDGDGCRAEDMTGIIETAFKAPFYGDTATVFDSREVGDYRLGIRGDVVQLGNYERGGGGR